jgi:uncharacterized Fe-S cluster protein YjdI
MMMEKTDRKYTNGEITVFWKPKKCIHVTTCYRELIEVFNPRKRPWVNMQGAPTEEIIRVVNLCPTQALSFQYNKDIDAEKQADNCQERNAEIPEVCVIEDGPVVIKGNFVLYDTNNTKLDHGHTVSICRCERSGNLPFCDGAHRKSGFKSK